MADDVTVTDADRDRAWEAWTDLREIGATVDGTLAGEQIVLSLARTLAEARSEGFDAGVAAERTRVGDVLTELVDTVKAELAREGMEF